MIKKLTLQIGEKEIELTQEEAKQLKEALNDLFGKPVETIVKHEYVPSWRRYWEPYWWGTAIGGGGLVGSTTYLAGSGCVGASNNMKVNALSEKPTYTETFRCVNCGHKEAREILRGCSVALTTKNGHCSRCGCKTLTHEPRGWWR